MMVWVEVSHKSIAAWLHLGGEGMTSDRVEIRALIFFLGVYIKHSCFIVPNYNSKISRCCWGDFSRSSSTLQCFFLNVIGDTVLTFIDEFEKTKAVQQQAFKAVIWRLDVTQLQKVYEMIFQGDSIGDHIFHGNDL